MASNAINKEKTIMKNQLLEIFKNSESQKQALEKAIKFYGNLGEIDTFSLKRNLLQFSCGVGIYISSSQREKIKELV
jgi:hypothetical protein